MAFLSTNVLDSGLSYATSNVNELTICSGAPSNYADAHTNLKLGVKATPTVGSPGARTPNGRKITISAISDGTVDGNGTATHWALTKTGTSELIAWGTLASGQGVTSGNTFTLTAFDIGIPDPA